MIWFKSKWIKLLQTVFPLRFNDNVYQEGKQGLSEPKFYGDLVYNF